MSAYDHVRALVRRDMAGDAVMAWSLPGDELHVVTAVALAGGSRFTQCGGELLFPKIVRPYRGTSRLFDEFWGDERDERNERDVVVVWSSRSATLYVCKGDASGWSGLGDCLHVAPILERKNAAGRHVHGPRPRFEIVRKMGAADFLLERWPELFKKRSAT
ncbi:MAG: hypothetical protein GHCLOJNM_01584 [bacterium]|nr:hypothetical protein [bacterium]